MLPTSTWLSYCYLNQAIKKKKFKVLLNGFGGDEFFSGYHIHQLHYLQSIKDKKLIHN
jgi:asparagine synthetase B (glutamine-hydrolysing)